jgi:hypothetical protein
VPVRHGARVSSEIKRQTRRAARVPFTPATESRCGALWAAAAPFDVCEKL